MSSEATPIIPHLASDFYTWLWWASEVREGVFELPDPVGRIDLWVDTRLAFRNPADTKVSTVLTGENPSTSLEARAALMGGKVLQELAIGMRRDDREYAFMLKGAGIEISRAKLPGLMAENEDGAVFDRMFVYDELFLVLGALFREFGAVRASSAWVEQVVPSIRAWIRGEP